MGTYLSSPVTTKYSEDGSNLKLSFGASSMQGWRVKQEDAHNCILEFDESTSLFAVYDGHGGSEVAIYTSQEFPTYLRNNEKYKKGLYEEALVEAFLGFDDTIATPEVMEQLKKLVNAENDKSEDNEETSLVECSRVGCSSSSNDDACDDDEEDFESLRREANKPLEEIMASYFVPKDSKLASPCLRGKRDTAGKSSSGSSGECSSSSIVQSSNDASSSECSSSAASLAGTKEVNGCSSSQNPSSGSAVNGHAESSSVKCDSSTGAVSKETENEADAQTCSKNELLTNGLTNESLVNGTASSANSDVKDPESTEKRAKRIPKEPAAKSTSSSEPGTSPKKKKLALTDLDDSDVVKNFITNDEIDENDEDDSEDETFQVSNDDLNSEDDDDDDDNDEGGFVFNKKTLTAALLRRLHQNNLGLYEDDDDDDDDDDDEDDEDDDQNANASKSSERKDEDEDEDREYEEAAEEEEDEDNSESIEEEEDEEDDDDEDGEDDLFTGGIEKPGADSGCTAVVALVKGNDLYVANAGDSRCIICKGGVAVDMSKDHNPELPTERSRIIKAGGVVTREGRVNDGLNLSRAIGDHSYKNNKELPNTEQMITALPDVRIVKLEPDVEFIVLACDGIWNSMTSQEVVDFIRPRIESNKKLSIICEEMFDKCLATNTVYDEPGCDNMTCIIVKISPNSSLTSSEQQATEISVPPVSNDTTASTLTDNTTSTSTDDTKEITSTKESVDENTSPICGTKSDEQNPSENSSSAHRIEDSSVSKELKRSADSTETEDVLTKRKKTEVTDAEASSCGDALA